MMTTEEGPPTTVTQKSAQIPPDALVVTLFYKYCAVANVPALVEEQRALLLRLSLCGRVRVAPEGVNSTVCGLETAVDAYEAATAAALPGETAPDFKRSVARAQPFADARVRAVAELVTLGLPLVSAADAADHVAPASFRDRLLAERAQRVSGADAGLVVLDVRNGYESDIGSFVGSVCPGIRQFSDFPSWARENSSVFSGKDVYMFCTGGVRCEKASAFLIEELGVERARVRQLAGGIVRFLDEFADGGAGDDSAGGSGVVWHGKNLVFDGRITDQGTDDVIGKCVSCSASCDDYGSNARCIYCRRRLLVCSLDDCATPRLCPSCTSSYEKGLLRNIDRIKETLQAGA